MRGRLAKIAYGTGNFGQALFFNSIQTFLIFFYTDTVRLDPKLVGLGFAISYGVWNAINDPLIGAVSDRTRSRWGRRIPYIMFGTPLVVLMYFLVWSPPLGGAALTGTGTSWGIFFYFAVIIALFDFVYTAVSVTYTAIFPEAFVDLSERTEVSIYRPGGGHGRHRLGRRTHAPCREGLLLPRRRTRRLALGGIGPWPCRRSGLRSLPPRQQGEEGKQRREADAHDGGLQGDLQKPSLPDLRGIQPHDLLYLELALGHGALLYEIRPRRRRQHHEPPLRRHVRLGHRLLSDLAKDHPPARFQEDTPTRRHPLCGLPIRRLLRQGASPRPSP